MDIKVPDIGDFKDVPVITVLVEEGDTVEEETPLIELESDKATMEVPSPAAGKVTGLKVKVGDKVTEGDVIMTIDAAGAEEKTPPKEQETDTPPEPAAKPEKPEEKADAPREAPKYAGEKGDIHAGLVVLGSGPGGYSAAFRAADLGLDVVLIERYPTLGGVCLNVGCIPSKALLHAAKVITEAEEMGSHGISFGKPKVEIDPLRKWKDGVVKQLTSGLTGLAKARKVKTVQGVGKFTGPNMIEVEGDGGKQSVSFDQCIIAAGSEPVKLPFIPHDDPRVIDSTGALELQDIPKKMLVLGGGIIGLEMACVYDALGAQITVVELMDQIIPGADKDIVKPLSKRIEGRYEKILLKTKVTDVKAQKNGLKVTFEDEKGETSSAMFDKVLVAVGRRPLGKTINAEAAGVTVDERGFVPVVDGQMHTNVGHIFAIGDIIGQPMLAHKAVHEGKVAAEVAAGHNRAFDARPDPVRCLHRPRGRLVRPDGDRGQGQGHQVRKGRVPMGRVWPRTVERPVGGDD